MSIRQTQQVIDNTAVGYGALDDNNNGSYNTAFAMQVIALQQVEIITLQVVTTDNTAMVGFIEMHKYTYCCWLCSIKRQTQQDNIYWLVVHYSKYNCSNNVAIGQDALIKHNRDTNVAVGRALMTKYNRCITAVGYLHYCKHNRMTAVGYVALMQTQQAQHCCW